MQEIGTGLASLLGELAHPSEGQREPTQLVSGAFDPASRFPAKVVARIEGLEFVEMSELLQESWATDGSESKLNHGRRDPVTDILVWAECFTGMAAILSPKFSQKAPELLAYMWRIIHADRKYDGAAWVTYDRMYKRQAVAWHSLDWSQEDQALYNELLAGWAKQCVCCKHCLSKHTTRWRCASTCQCCPLFFQSTRQCRWPPRCCNLARLLLFQAGKFAANLMRTGSLNLPQI